MNMGNEIIYSVLKYIDNDKDAYIYSTIVNIDDMNESFNYYQLTIQDNIPTITDIENPIEILKSIKTKAIDVKEDSFQYMRFLAYKKLAEENIIKKMN